MKLNPDSQCPADPGSFHNKADAKRQIPHSFNSKFEGKADTAVGEAYLLQCTAGPVRSAFAFKSEKRLRYSSRGSWCPATNAGLNKIWERLYKVVLHPIGS